MSDLKEKAAKRSFLARLRKNEAGNTLAIVGASLVPLTILIGGGVDTSRTYMVKSRLQQACDAGVLAGRKAVGDGDYDTEAEGRANAFFAANFPTAFQGAEPAINIGDDDAPEMVAFSSSSPNDGSTINGTAKVTLPTTIMGLFSDEKDRRDKLIAEGKAVSNSFPGKGLTTNSVEITVNCSASLEVGNSDVTMVVDTTGSMRANISNGTGGTTTRILALRAAMNGFYDTLSDASDGTNARIRYSLIPYASTVNVGRLLLAEDPNYIVGGNPGEFWNYQSRRPVYRVTTTTGGPPVTTQETFNPGGPFNDITQYQCENWGNNQSASYWYYQNGWNNPTYYPSPSGNPIVSGGTTTTYTFVSVSNQTDPGYYSTCVRNKTVSSSSTVTTETYEYSPGAVFLRYEYDQINWPVSDFVDTILTPGSTIALPTEDATTGTISTSWGGCIEERATVRTPTVAYDASAERITPLTALDLDIDSAPIPGQDNTRWKPLWPEVLQLRSGLAMSNSGSKPSVAACTHQATLHSEMTDTEFENYTTNLNPNGSTYHDIGLMWGARLSSEAGIFADNVNSPAANGGFVSRHMLFMTDGTLETYNEWGNAWGLEFLDRRVTDDGVTDDSLRHRQRFLAICEAIKAKGIRLWVVAFATSLTSDLQQCSSPEIGRAHV